MKYIKFILAIIATAIICTTIGVCAANINARQVYYTRNNNDMNVEDALDELYGRPTVLSEAISEISHKSITLENNTYSTLYVALFSTTTASSPSSRISNRTTINTISGADYQELFYKFSSSNNYGIRVYRLTNCQSTVSITAKSDSDGSSSAQLVVFH